MGRKLSLLIAAVVIGTIIYAGVVTWKPVVGETVGNVLNDQVAKPGGLAIGNLASAVVSNPFWKTYIAPTPNAFAIGIGTCIVGLLLLRKVNIRGLFGKAKSPATALSGLDSLQREPAEPERQATPSPPRETVASPEQLEEKPKEVTEE